MDTEWRTLAACNSDDVNPDWFFPGDTIVESKANYKKAKAVCARCPVIAECRADMETYVNGDNEDVPLVGVFAGTTVGERTGKNEASRRYEQANKEAYAAKRRARDKARRQAETPEQREARLAKHRAWNQAYERRKKVAV